MCTQDSPFIQNEIHMIFSEFSCIFINCIKIYEFSMFL